MEALVDMFAEEAVQINPYTGGVVNSPLAPEGRKNCERTGLPYPITSKV